MSITVKQVSKGFGSFRALEHVSLEVAGGSLVALLGPSGSGKTTLLRIIAGLEVADTGTVLYQDEDVTDAAVKDRNVGFVFQHYALLLDEPFGALDAKVRQDLRQWLRRLHDEIHVTSVFVTHDQEEAFEVADRVVIMNHGHVEQTGTPREIFERPANPFVMGFLGNV